MTDRLALGITVGASRSVAVATAADGGEPVAVIQRSTTVEVATAGPAVLVEGFLSRVGDPVRMLAQDGSSHVAADLVAAATTQLIADLTDADATVVSCHPGWWPEVRVQAVRAALDSAGAGAVVLVPEPLAVVRRYEIERGPLDEGALVVYDLGDSGLTVSVVQTGEKSGLLGVPAHSAEIAGSEFDLLTMRYVLGHALGDTEIDPFDPAVETELAALRERCRTAKQTLSLDTATVVSVGALATDGTGQVRIVRNELEDLLRSDVRDSLDLVREAVRQAGVELRDVTAVLLTGGGGAIPLVAELISAEFGLPVVACEDPATASAAGAAELAADLLAAENGVPSLSATAFVAAESGWADAAAKIPDSDVTSTEAEYEPSAVTLGKHSAADSTSEFTTDSGRHAENHSDLAATGSALAMVDGPIIDDEEPPRQLVTRKRLAVIAAAVAVFGALTAGTLAVAPQFASPSTPTPLNDVANTNSPVSVAVTPPLDANGKPVLGTPTLDATGKPIPGAPTLDPTGKPIPGTTVDAAGHPVVGTPTVDATGQPIAPGTQNPVQGAAPQVQQPQQQVQSGGTAPAQGAPAPAPAPQQQAPAPAPQQQPAPQQPAPQQPTPQPAPQMPAPQPAVPDVGAVPGQVLDGAGEVVEETVGGVTELPGGLLGGGN